MKRVVIVLSAILTLGFTAYSQSLEVKTGALANGMKVLVHEDHSIPSVALYVFYRIGSRNEHPGTTGLSHFFEHMMFNGAKKYGPKQFDVSMEAAGGSNNAYTSYDVTVYQDWFPPSALELIFDLEADRIHYLSFDPKMVESERGVVASERRSSVEGNNQSLLSEQLWAAAFTAHPYQWPVVGWMVDIENWKMDDLKHHFQMGYSPSNATMVVAGDVTYDQIMSLARRYLEPIPSHEPPPPVTTQEPVQLGERRVTLHKFAQLPFIEFGYHVPRSSDPDYYALDVLTGILFSGDSSRMYQRLVDREQLAIAVDGGSDLALDPTLFQVFIQPKEGIATTTVEKSFLDEISRVATSGVSANEVQKAKNILLANFYRQMKTINGKANEIGRYEVFFGDYRKLFSAASEYEKVTADDVKRVAAKYFGENNRTVATLIPEAEKPAPAKPPARQKARPRRTSR